MTHVSGDSSSENTSTTPDRTIARESDWLCGDEAQLCRFQQELITLRQQVIRDPLTQLNNVRYLLEAIDRETERTERSGLPTCLMMVDLDHFKQVNDTWGHEAGNRVLVATARVIRESTRKLDIQCRYGGEEFAIVLPTTSLMAARPVAERIRENIAGLSFDEQEQTFTVTASIGIAMVEQGEGLQVSEFIERADAELYRAKESGRNRVCVMRESLADSHVNEDEKDLMWSLFGGDRDQEDGYQEDFDQENSDPATGKSASDASDPSASDWMAEDWDDDSPN